jgi:peptidoglycan/xylan/chitin deacetylase (PgdA/CDA1 family)
MFQMARSMRFVWGFRLMCHDRFVFIKTPVACFRFRVPFVASSHCFLRKYFYGSEEKTTLKFTHNYMMLTLRLFAFSLLASISVSCSVISGESSLPESEIMTWKDGKTGAISITYDDATINQFRKALPIMDSLGMKGTFFINTADIPDSKFPPKYFGRPLKTVISESTTPTTRQNIFERASALRFLDIENAIEDHNRAGSLYENEKYEEAFGVVDKAFARARKKGSFKEVTPVLLTGDLITWPEIKKFAESGHEFGNHTISHPRLAVLDEQNLLYELEKCKEEIQLQLGAKHVFSCECPFGTENERVMQYAYKVHPALRNRMPEPFLEELNRGSRKAPSVSDKPYVQWQRGPLIKTTVAEMKSYVDTLLVHDNIWLVLTFHGVDGIGWEAKPSADLRAYFSYMKQYEDSLWVAPFGDVTKYIRQKMNAKAETTSTGNTRTIRLAHTLGSLYDFPLTVKTYVDRDWEKITVVQGKRKLAHRMGSDGKGSYVMYDALANSNDIVVSGE